MEGETPGQRLYMIRLALGDGLRNPEKADAFVRRVKHVTGVSYDPSTISRLESGKRKWKLDDVAAFAAVDPRERGPTWLAAFDVEDVELVPRSTADTPVQTRPAAKRKAQGR